MANCSDKEEAIWSLMWEGTTRSRAQELIEQIENKIAAFAAECDSDKAAFMRSALAKQFRHRKYQEVESDLKTLLSRLPEDRLRLDVLSLLASYSYREIPWIENKGYRISAIELAEKLDISSLEKVILLANTRYAAAEEGEDVGEISAKIELLLPHLNPSPRSKDAEVISRDLSFRARAILKEAAFFSGVARRERINSAIFLYKRAIELQSTVDHLRVNLQIELTESLLDISDQEKEDFDWILDTIHECLDDAYSDLGSHPCSACRGYFYRMRAAYHRNSSISQRRFDNRSAISSLENAMRDIEKADAEWQNIGDQLRSLISQKRAEIREDMKIMTKPRRIFLSHAGANKSMVRRFRQLLETLRYEPWMDENDMKAGATLNRAIIDGMDKSCAAVFFITDNFKDEKWIAQEIDLATERKINDDSFSIITLVFRSEGKDPPTVPAPLRRYVWKDVHNEVEGIKEIIDALPLAPTIPIWR